MAKLNVSAGDFDPKNWGRLHDAIRKGIETYDFDSGWIATPANKVIQHKLGVLPKAVTVYASDNANGSPMSPDVFTSCNLESVTISGPKPYCRVLVDV